jgi:two-component system osmolarity sensor histidine kinase EnvZ
MRVPLPPQSAVVKRLMPRSLLARTLLIMMVPLVVVQAVALQIFYGSHLDIVSRRLSAGVAGEIATCIDLMELLPGPVDQAWIVRNASDQFDLALRFEPGAQLPRGQVADADKFSFVNRPLVLALQDKLLRPFSVDSKSDPQAVLIRVQITGGVLDIDAPRKRLFAATIYIFVLWLVGSSLTMFGISALFMRNQVRAIRRLAAAAEAFGIGRDPGPIKPAGATEVRQAAVAFNRMQDRIRRFLQQRTEMLAGVSHDLRTPLTRLRLALAVMPQTEALRQDVADMTADVEEMERMIGAYLAFARGEGIEQARPTDLSAVLEDVAAGARRAGARVALATPAELVMPLRADALRRAVTNLVDNARRHSRHISLAAQHHGERFVQVTVDDDGPGIPLDQREFAFKPFESGSSGGTGLGLSIARDIVRAHGGDIMLEDSPLGGLRARIQLPV